MDAEKGELATFSLQRRDKNSTGDNSYLVHERAGPEPRALDSLPKFSYLALAACVQFLLLKFFILFLNFILKKIKKNILGSLQLCVITKQSISPLERNSITCSIKGSQLLLTGSLESTKHSSLLLYFIINLLMLTNVLYIIQSTLINKTEGEGHRGRRVNDLTKDPIV